MSEVLEAFLMFCLDGCIDSCKLNDKTNRRHATGKQHSVLGTAI